MPMFDTIISFSMSFFISMFLGISCYKLLYIRYTSVMSNYVQGTLLLKFNNFVMCLSHEANVLGLTILHKFTDNNLDRFGKGDFSVSKLTSNDSLPSTYMSYQIMLAYCLVVNLSKLYIQKAWKISKLTDIIYKLLCLSIGQGDLCVSKLMSNHTLSYRMSASAIFVHNIYVNLLQL